MDLAFLLINIATEHAGAIEWHGEVALCIDSDEATIASISIEDFVDDVVSSFVIG